MAIIITGNPVDGFIFYGPFENMYEAFEWGDKELRGVDWWTGTLYKEVQ